MEEKIKDIYQCKPEKTDIDDPLVKWYNSVIEKDVSQLTKGDAARCIRQNVFVETAAEAILGYLLDNPLAGDMFEGELMEKAAQIDSGILKKYSSAVSEILNKSYLLLEDHIWDFTEDRQEFYESVRKLEAAIK